LVRPDGDIDGMALQKNDTKVFSKKNTNINDVIFFLFCPFAQKSLTKRRSLSKDGALGGVRLKHGVFLTKTQTVKFQK